MINVVVLLALLLVTSCSPKPEPILDQATVVAKNASLRQRSSSTSRTLRTLGPGDRVEVLERQNNWYRVRYGPDVQGWMEESTVVTNATRERIRTLVSASRDQLAQNTGADSIPTSISKVSASSPGIRRSTATRRHSASRGCAAYTRSKPVRKPADQPSASTSYSPTGRVRARANSS